MTTTNNFNNIKTSRSSLASRRQDILLQNVWLEFNLALRIYARSHSLSMQTCEIFKIFENQIGDPVFNVNNCFQYVDNGADTYDADVLIEKLTAIFRCI